jgi:hypothetical protein
MGIKRDKSGKCSSQIVPRIWNSRPSCLVSTATQSKPGLLADKLSEVQMSYFYLCLRVCQHLWIIKFLEWAYRKKMGDMRGYFHRLGYWGFIIRLILLRFSFVFHINLPICKSNRMVLNSLILTHTHTQINIWHLNFWKFVGKQTRLGSSCG